MSCQTCVHFGEERDGDYGQIFCGYTCNEHPNFQNLRSFPFKKKKDCHVLDFWHSEFANGLDGTEENYAKAIDRWRESVGWPKLEKREWAR